MDTPSVSGYSSNWRPDGQQNGFFDPNGTTTNSVFDAAGRVTQIKTFVTATPTTVRAQIDYTYNRAGLARTEAQTITGATAGNGTASFAYDHLGRLTGYDSPIGAASDKDYAWAKVANRTGVTSDPSGTPSTTTYTFNAADRITADSPSTGTYGSDASGRVTARPARQFVWDSLGRLTTVKDGSGTTLVTYGYDPLDRLRTTSAAGVTLRYRYAGRSTSIAQVYDETAADISRNFANDLAERPVGSFGTTGASPASWIVNAHQDIVGSTSSTGTVGRWYRYDPWGTLVASGGTGFTPIHRFQGSFGDLTAGLIWMVSRWYDPSLGRFLSEDSLLGEPRNPDSRHRYAYGEGDPVNTWDPDGRFPWRAALYVVAVPVVGFLTAVQNQAKFQRWMQSFMSRDIQDMDDLLLFIRDTDETIFGNREREAAARALVMQRLVEWKASGATIRENLTCYSSSTLVATIYNNPTRFTDRNDVRNAAMRGSAVNVPVLSSVCVRLNFRGGRLTTPTAYDRRSLGPCRWEPYW